MTSRLLLDTCAMLYVTEQRLGEGALQALDEAFGDGVAVSISEVSAWEIGMLSARGRLSLTVPPLRFFAEFAALPGIRVERLTPSILVDSSFLPPPIHRDPADRMIVATARTLDLTIMTSDRQILDYAGRGHVHAMDC